MHALEQHGFEASFASRSEPAWHGLGTVFEGEVSTKEMLDLSKLSGWNVRLVSVSDALQDWNHVTDEFFVIRDNPYTGKIDRLATVGSKYHVLSNEDAFAFADNIVDGGGVWETAGSLHGGRKYFGSMSLGDDIVLDPSGAGDTIKPYLLITSSHDGSTPTICTLVMVRVVCANTLNVALRSATNMYRLRHTMSQSHEGRVMDARAALEMSFKHHDAFENEAKRLFETTVTKDQFDKIITAQFGEPGDSKLAQTKDANRRDLIMDIWAGSASGPDTMSTITGTAWGAYNAINEYLSWYRKPQKGNVEKAFLNASGFDDATNAASAKAFATVKQFVA